MADDLQSPYLVTMLMPTAGAAQTEMLSNGHHYTRDVEHDCVHVWDHDVSAMRALGYRETTDDQAETHRARREAALPAPHLEALRAAQVTPAAVATATPTAGDPVVLDAQKAADKAAAAEAKAQAQAQAKK